MKAIWKFLLGAAAVAAVTPYKVQKDEETGSVKITSATWSATYCKDENGANVAVKLLPALTKKEDECECECCCDDECCCEDEECCCCGEESAEEGITVEVEPEESCCCGCQEHAEPENA